MNEVKFVKENVIYVTPDFEGVTLHYELKVKRVRILEESYMLQILRQELMEEVERIDKILIELASPATNQNEG